MHIREHMQSLQVIEDECEEQKGDTNFENANFLKNGLFSFVKSMFTLLSIINTFHIYWAAS